MHSSFWQVEANIGTDASLSVKPNTGIIPTRWVSLITKVYSMQNEWHKLKLPKPMENKIRIYDIFYVAES